MPSPLEIGLLLGAVAFAVAALAACLLCKLRQRSRRGRFPYVSMRSVEREDEDVLGEDSLRGWSDPYTPACRTLLKIAEGVHVSALHLLSVQAGPPGGCRDHERVLQTYAHRADGVYAEMPTEGTLSHYLRSVIGRRDRLSEDELNAMLQQLAEGCAEVTRALGAARRWPLCPDLVYVTKPSGKGHAAAALCVKMAPLAVWCRPRPDEKCGD